MKNCPQCHSENIYYDGALWNCPDCQHEWTEAKENQIQGSIVDENKVKDANGVILTDGDAVVVLKDLKIKGASSTIKGGTKVKNIRLDDLGDGHNILCRIEGVGTIHLKSEFVKKFS